VRGYTLILTNARLVDPANRVDGPRDVAIQDGKVAAVDAVLEVENAEAVIDLHGRTVVPGIIDPHAHFVNPRFGARAYRMMVKAGVVTGIDQGGTMEEVFASLPVHGVGMNLAVNTEVRTSLSSPKDPNPDRGQLRRSVTEAVTNGALGVKILGGGESLPALTPEATTAAIDVANEQRVYVAYHVGTSATSSSLDGLREALELAGGNRLHIAHINSYCRGQIQDPMSEATEALRLLQGQRHIVSESYLSPYNSSSGECVNGVPVNRVTRTCLTLRGYPVTENGLRQAIRDEYCLVQAEVGASDTVHLRRGEALRHWSNAGSRVRVAFPVNVPEATVPLAIGKDGEGAFIVDAITTDGGAAPRNVQVRSGLALVRFGALTLSEFALKTSYNASRMFGMLDKGHLGVGADADVTVLDLQNGTAVMSLARGQVIMLDGVVAGRSGTIITTKRGEPCVARSGLPYQLIDLSESRFFTELKG
jgi:cytosine/adenosine deaminase-related metal-dependent hydrolase